MIRNTNLVEDFGEVVGDDGVAGPLGEEPKSNEDQQTVTITLGPEKFKDAVLGVLLFERKGGFDFAMNELDSDIVGVIKGVVVSEDSECPIWSILLNIPTG